MVSRRHSEMTKSELREEERNYCLNNIEYFIDTYGHIEDRDAPEGVIPYRMWPKQREDLNSIMTHKFNIILKARQLGYSWLACHIVSHLIVTSGNKQAIGLSKSEEEAKELVRRVAMILRFMPELVAEKGYEPRGWDGPIFNATALSVEVTYPDRTVSNFKALASSPGAGRSFTANIVIFDEWAFQGFAQEIWDGAYPTINRPNGGRFIGLSTIKRGSLFEELFTGDNMFNKIFTPWYADPSRDEAWYERTRRTLGDGITAEYPATIDEAMQVPGGAYFPEVSRKTHEVDELASDRGEPVKRICAIDYGLDALAAVFVEVDRKGYLTCYRYYEAPDLLPSQAAAVLKSLSAYETIDLWLAPNDLEKRNYVDGRSTFQLFRENGINFVAVDRDMHNGCIALKEALGTLEGEDRPMLTFLKGCSDKDRVWEVFRKIQKNEKDPTVYERNKPHELSHCIDSMRYLTFYWKPKVKIEEAKKGKRKWRKDLIEDYRRANSTIKALMIKELGEPIF